MITRDFWTETKEFSYLQCLWLTVITATMSWTTPMKRHDPHRRSRRITAGPPGHPKHATWGWTVVVEAALTTAPQRGLGAALCCREMMAQRPGDHAGSCGRQRPGQEPDPSAGSRGRVLTVVCLRGVGLMTMMTTTTQMTAHSTVRSINCN